MGPAARCRISESQSLRLEDSQKPTTDAAQDIYYDYNKMILSIFHSWHFVLSASPEKIPSPPPRHRNLNIPPRKNPQCGCNLSQWKQCTKICTNAIADHLRLQVLAEVMWSHFFFPQEEELEKRDCHMTAMRFRPLSAVGRKPLQVWDRDRQSSTLRKGIKWSRGFTWDTLLKYGKCMKSRVNGHLETSQQQRQICYFFFPSFFYSLRSMCRLHSNQVQVLFCKTLF